MTIGEGIFWSTIVIVVFVSIVLLSKYGKWKIFFKCFSVLLGLGGVISLGVWAFSKYENRPQKMNSLNGIHLGMSLVDVTLAKGKPDDESDFDPTPDGFRKFLLYGNFQDSYTYAILRGPKESMIVTDVCDKGGYGRVLGFSKFSSEQSIVEKLGEPSNISINEKGTEKILSFEQWNAAFEIAKGSVVKVCVTSWPQMRYSKEFDQPSEKVKSQN